MDVSRAPAAAHAAAFALGVGALRALPHPPSVACLALLAALGVALGRRPGRWLASAALGALLAVSAAPPSPPEAGRIVSAIGRIGSRFHVTAEGSRVPLRTERIARPGGRSGRGPDLQLHFPPGSPLPTPGSRVRVRGPIGRSPGFSNQRRVEPGPWRLRIKSPVFVTTIQPATWLGRLATASRRRSRESFARAQGDGPRPGLRVARALLLGEPEALDEDWLRALRRTGLGHLAAVSGFHVSLVALLTLIALAPAPGPLRSVALALAILAYLGVVGPTASTLRASAMALLALVGLACGRAPSARQALALVLVALLAENPARLGETGFRLSFSATAGLLSLAPRWSRRLSSRLPRPVALGLAATLAAQAASLPFAVEAFGELSPAAPLFNLAAAPWAACVLAAALTWLATSAASPALAAALAPGLDPLAWPLEALAAIPASRWISLSWPGGWIAGLWAGLALVVIGEGGRVRRVGVLSLGLLLQTGHGAAPAEPFELVALDVGQGDAMLLHRGSAAILIDGGGGPTGGVGHRVVRPALADRGIRRLDAVLLTHADADHCRGLVETVSEVPIGALWATAGAAGTDCLERLSAAARRPAVELAAGSRLLLGEIRLDVLHPGADRPIEPGNASSLVAKLTAGGLRILLTGDVGAEQEAGLVLRQRDALRCDLLKVAHHGSAGSSSLPFLAAARPRLAILSAGASNAYGHPSQSALARFRRLGIRVLRTDRDGGISIRWRPGCPLRIDLPGSPRPRR